MGGKYGSKRAIAPELEQDVIDLYQRVHTARVVAEAHGVSDETIRRILRRHGIPRTRLKKQTKPQNLWKAELNQTASEMYASGCTCDEIGKCLGYSGATVYNHLRKLGVTKKGAPRLTKEQQDKICNLYNAGVSNAEIARRFGIKPQTVSKVVARNGCEMRGRGGNPSAGGAAHAAKVRRESIRKFDAVSDVVELLEYGSPAKVRCRKCGTEYNWVRDTWKAIEPCPGCRQEKLELQKEQTRQVNERRHYEREQQKDAAREWRLSVPFICKECGEPFYADQERAYCCDACRRRAANHRKKRRLSKGSNPYKRRMRIKVTRHTYDRTVTLDAVYKKFHGKCCECGCKTVRTKGYDPRQATLDHIVALGNFGTHTWDNVQLLCAACNSEKRDLGQMRLAIAV